MSDMEGSGRKNENRTHPFIVIKNSSQDPANSAKCRRIAVRRNVFCNWQGGSDQSYVLVGEDAKDFWEAQDVTIENNLFLFNNANPSTGAVTLKCHVRNVAIRANTVLGTVYGWTCYALRCSQEKAQLAMEDVYIYNNIFDDPAGKMPQLIWGRPEFVRKDLVLLNNLYWNGGRAFPHHETTLLKIPADDPAAIVADPRLAHPAKMIIPRWDAAGGALRLRADAHPRRIRAAGQGLWRASARQPRHRPGRPATHAPRRHPRPPSRRPSRHRRLPDHPALATRDALNPATRARGNQGIKQI